MQHRYKIITLMLIPTTTRIARIVIIVDCRIYDIRSEYTFLLIILIFSLRWYVFIVFHFIQHTTSITGHHRHIRPFASTQFNSLHFIFCLALRHTIWNQSLYQPTLSISKQKKKQHQKQREKTWRLVCSSLFIINFLFTFDKLIPWIFIKHTALIIFRMIFHVGR